MKPALIALDPVERTVYFTSQATADKSDGYVIRSCALDAAPGAGASPPPAPVLAQCARPTDGARARHRRAKPHSLLLRLRRSHAQPRRARERQHVRARANSSRDAPARALARPKYVRVAPGVEGRGDALHLVQQDTTTRASQIVAIDIHALERLSCAASGCNASGVFRAVGAADGAAGRDGVSDELRAIARIVVGAKDAGYPDGIAHGCGGHDLWSSDKYGGPLNASFQGEEGGRRSHAHASAGAICTWWWAAVLFRVAAQSNAGRSPGRAYSRLLPRSRLSWATALGAVVAPPFVTSVLTEQAQSKASASSPRSAGMSRSPPAAASPTPTEPRANQPRRAASSANC